MHWPKRPSGSSGRSWPGARIARTSGEYSASSRRRRPTCCIADVESGVVAAFIHDVVATPESERADHASRGVRFFDTYAGAAAAALSLGLVDRSTARRVAEAARAELEAIAFTSDDQRRARLAELEREAASLFV